MGPVSLKQMSSFEHLKNGDSPRKFLLQIMFFNMNVSNTKSKNLVLASPLKQNLNKIRSWLVAPEPIMALLTYARHNQFTIRLELGTRYLKSSGAAAAATWQKKERRCRFSLLK